MIRRWQRHQTRFSAHDHALVLTAALPEPGEAGSEGGRQGARDRSLKCNKNPAQYSRRTRDKVSKR
jgi:hypothetical protein